MLKQRETGEECDAIHIFPTNAQVDEYRNSMSCVLRQSLFELEIL